MAVKKEYTAAVNNTRSVKMATVDLSKLSYAELEKLVADATALKASKRDSEITAFVDKTVAEAEAIGLSLDDLIKALQPRAPKSGPVRAKRASSGASAKTPIEFKKGVKYKTKGGVEWTRPESGKGRVPTALLDAVAAGESVASMEAHAK